MRTSENSVKWKSNFRESPECELRGDGVLRSSHSSGLVPRTRVETSPVRFLRKLEVPRESTVLGGASYEQRTRQGSAEGMRSAVLVCDGDHAVQGAHLFYTE